MFILDDKMIDTTIDNIAGYIISTVANETGKSLSDVAEQFFASEIYQKLSNKDTGYYWDSIPEMIDIFYSEIDS